MNLDGPRAPTIAIATATLALVMGTIALVVVVTRSPKMPEGGATAFETTVSAADVVKLRRDSLELAKDEGGIVGAKVLDGSLRAALGLQVDDVIAAIAGRPIKTEQDINTMIRGLTALDPTMLYVDVVRDGEPILLRWKLDDNLRTMRRNDQTSRPPSDVSDPDPVDDLQAAIDAIRKIDDNHYELPKSTVEAVLINPMAMAKGARVVPAMSMGKVEGFKLYAIRPSSIYAKLGFSNGDTLRTINGFELTSADKALEIYTRLRDATSLEIELTRRGSDETIRIDIR